MIIDKLLQLDSLIVVFILAFVVSVISTAAYKFFTDQELMKSLRSKQKDFQKQMKEHRKNPEKMIHLQRQAMDANMQYMMQSMKPMLFTFLPIILIFGWAKGHLAVESLQPGMPFTGGVILDEGISGNVSVITPPGLEVDSYSKEINNETIAFTYTGERGDYLISYMVNGEEYDQEIIINPNHVYASPVIQVEDGTVKSLFVNQDKLIILDLFGWRLGWLGSYILMVLILSLVLKKVFKVH